MKRPLVAHLALAGLLAGTLAPAGLAQSADDTPRQPRLKLPSSRQPAVAVEASPGQTQDAARPAPQAGRPRLGVTIAETDEGLVVDEVQPGSLAADAGVQSGDLLLSFGGRRVGAVDDIRDVLARARPGQELGLTVVRDGSGLVKLEGRLPRPEAPKAPERPSAPATDGQRGGFLGVQLGESEDGVLVAGVVEQSAAWFAGLQEGDVLTMIGGGPVRSGQDVAGAVASKAPGSFVRLTYERGGESNTVRVRLGSRAPSPAALGNVIAPRVRGMSPGAQSMVLPFGGGDHDFFVLGEDGDGGFTFDMDGQQFQVIGPDGQDHAFRWFSSDGDGDGPHGLHFDHDGDNVFTFELDGEHHGLALPHGMVQSFGAFVDDDALGGATSLKVEIEDGQMTIERDGEVQVIPLGDLEQLEGLEGLEALEDLQIDLPKGLMKLMKPGQDGGDRKVRWKIQRSSNTQGGQPRIRTMSLGDGTTADIAVITTDASDDCCAAEADACCEMDTDCEDTADCEEPGVN